MRREIHRIHRVLRLQADGGLPGQAQLCCAGVLECAGEVSEVEARAGEVGVNEVSVSKVSVVEARLAHPRPDQAGQDCGSMPEQVGQHHGLADVGALRGGEQREGAVSGQVAQVLKGLGALGLLELGPVAAAELLKALRGVAIPRAQRR